MIEILPTATATEEAERGAKIAVLPVGSFEQHGSHLPLSTDFLIACIIAKEVAEAYNLLLLPPITIGCSHEHVGLGAGTVSIKSTTLHAIINDIADSLDASGIHRLLIVNGHGGNYVLSNVVQEASVREPRMALFPTGADWRHAREEAGLVTDSHADMHAGELETSILLFAIPGLVGSAYQVADHESGERSHLLSWGMRAYTATGTIGRPSLGSEKKGESITRSLTRLAESHLESLAR